MDEYEGFVKAEKIMEKMKGGRGKLAGDVEEVIKRVLKHAKESDGVKMIRKQVLEMAVRIYWKPKLETWEKEVGGS